MDTEQVDAISAVRTTARKKLKANLSGATFGAAFLWGYHLLKIATGHDFLSGLGDMTGERWHFFAVGSTVFFGIFAILKWMWFRQLSEHGQFATGLVASTLVPRVKQANYFVDGKEYSIKGDDLDLKVGDQVRVLYDTTHPSRAEIITG